MLAPSASPSSTPATRNRLAGFVLVGGLSSRMGKDKARLPWLSKSLLEHVAGTVAAAIGSVVLIGAPDRYEDLPFERLPDKRPGFGPLGGIETAIQTHRAEWNLIVACDMPGLTQDTLQALLAETYDDDLECIAAREADGRLHPLCAVYRDKCLPKVQHALNSGHLQLHRVLHQLVTRLVDIDQPISNLNTPEDYKEWLLLHPATNV